jgi:hypothetical protein
MLPDEWVTIDGECNPWTDPDCPFDLPGIEVEVTRSSAAGWGLAFFLLLAAASRRKGRR